MAWSKTVFFVFIAASLLVGRFIPSFYIWTDSDQSRPSPLLWQVPLVSSMVSVAFCVALPWLPTARLSPNVDAPREKQFSIRTMMFATAIVAVAIALLSQFALVVSGMLSACTFAYFIAFFVRNPHYRLPAAALVASMIFPFTWILSYGELGRIFLGVLLMFSGLPAFLPAEYIAHMFKQNMHDGLWIAILLTALELFIGIWMIRLGPKRTIAYLLLVIHLSAVSSLGFHMGVLA